MASVSSSRVCELTPLFTALIVDDDPAVCATLSQALRQAGFEPLALRQTARVLEEVRGRRFNLAFIDCKTTDAVGLELASTLKLHHQVGDCIVMSTGATLDTMVRAVKLGAYDFLQKPFSQADLKLIIARVRERWDLKQRVRRAELQHAALIQNIPLLIYALSQDLAVSFINKTVEDMLGFSPEEALSAPRWLLERMHPQDREPLASEFAASFQSGQPVSVECRLLHRKGMVVHGIMRTIPYLECDTNAGQIRRLDGIFIDLTDRIHLEQALIQSAKLKTLGAISAEVAHEVRNPLMSIAGFARRLEKKAPDSPEVGIILRESKRLESLLNRIRDYLKPVETHAKDVQVNAMLADALHLLALEMDARQVRCELDLDHDLPAAKADPNVLTQVALDLMRGALAATPPGEAFRLRTRVRAGVSAGVSAGAVLIELRQRFDPEKPVDPDMIFLPFDEDSYNEGMPMSHRLIKSMGGALGVSVEKDGDRAEVAYAISLPASQGAGRGLGAAPGASVPGVKGAPMEGLAAAVEGVPVSRHAHCFENGGDVISRHLFEDLLARSLRAAQHHGAPLSLILVDLDRFEAWQKLHGDEAAEATLHQVSEALSAALARHPCALLVRHGAHELAVLLPAMAQQEALTLAEQLRRVVCSLRIPFQDTPDGLLTISLGVASTLDRSQTAEDLVAEANQALYLAKQQGRNAVRCA